MTATPERNESALVWLVSEGRVLASARRAITRAERRRGLIGVTSVSEPLVLEPCSWIHTVGMRTAIDVVYVANDCTVLSTSHMRPWRVGPLTRNARFIVEAAPGSIERWNVKPGDKLEIRNVEP
ncbi:MAG: hypothetical protein RLY24_860 [Actinomycetota bacterium]|jgi:uncharacterized membrane protein (UPF0127 family)